MRWKCACAESSCWGEKDRIDDLSAKSVGRDSWAIGGYGSFTKIGWSVPSEVSDSMVLSSSLDGTVLALDWIGKGGGFIGEMFRGEGRGWA